MKTVLIIAGSDPGAGAGLQQDLKVVTLMGTYGLTVVSALTVQNSLGVRAVQPVALEVVEAQLEALLQDFPIAAVKIGMLGTTAIVASVARQLREFSPVPLVLDPVLAASDGASLLDEAGIATLKQELLPLTHILTPNVPEAERLTGLKIATPAHLEEAARRLQALGPRWVLAKGGHLPGAPVDILTDGKNSYHLSWERLSAPHSHGSGCALASACAAGLALGLAVPEAVQRARQLLSQALRYGLPLGRGRGPVNPYAPFARELARYEVLEALREAAARLQKEGLDPLVPEVMSNLGYATPYPQGPQDVAAFPGRLRQTPQGLMVPPPAFGASRHVAAIILAAMQTHPELRAAMNLKYFEGVAELAPLLHLRAVSFNRSQEPPEIQAQEGGTLAWAVASVLAPGEPAPDLIFDKGGWGQEPMIRLLGPTPMAVAEKALALKNALQAEGRL
jgi:hydroxymethylpyrimidine/phosphomethylpyrimidine kinase